MTEKKKWFDRDSRPQQLIVLPGMRDTSPVTIYQWQRLNEELSDSKLSVKTLDAIDQLGSMPATARLARNLKLVLDKLQQGDTGHSLRELITDKEYEILRELNLANLTTESQQVVYRLLNIGERFQAQTTLKTVFAAARLRPVLPSRLTKN